MEEGKNNRRDFLKGLAVVLGGLVAIDTSAFSVMGYASFKDYMKYDSMRDPSIVTEKDVPPRKEGDITKSVESVDEFRYVDNLILDRVVEGMPIRFHGVSHHRRFAMRYYWSIDDLVKNCMLVLSEGSPKDLENPRVTHDGKAYFGTMINLCKKYDKPLIEFVGNSGLAIRSETIAGVAGTLLSIESAKQAYTHKISRRKAFSLLGLNLFGAYLASSSFILGNNQRMIIDHISPDLRDSYDFDRFMLSHIIDQRNVKFTDNLLKLIPKITGEDRKGGDYILVETGRLHTVGMEYYLKHRTEFAAKKALYAPTYGAIDSDSIHKFTPTRSGWESADLIL